ncbi:MAG: hypothetical protein F7B19_06135 [Desulfurococcales archaeon]|nr:hypothetical protein [Desulfurococcales archaeon]
MIKKAIPVNEARRQEEYAKVDGRIDNISKYIDDELSKMLAADEKLRIKISYQTAVREEGESSLEEALGKLLRITSKLKKGAAALLMYTEDKEIIMYLKAPNRKVALVVITPEECICGENAFKLYKNLKGWYQISFFSE